MQIRLNEIAKQKLGIVTAILFVLALGIFIRRGADTQTKSAVELASEKPKEFTAGFQMRQKRGIQSLNSTTPLSIGKTEEAIDMNSESLPAQIESYFSQVSPQKRALLVAAANKEPGAFVKLCNELLNQLPFDQVEVRNEIYGLMIDNAALVRSTQNEQLKKEYFQTVQLMVNRDLGSEELMQSKLIDSLSGDQKHALMHGGFIVERNGAYFRSSLTTKIMALSLEAQNPNKNDRKQILQQIEQYQIGNSKMDAAALSTIKIAAKNLLVIVH
jgi:hypothetical protein